MPTLVANYKTKALESQIAKAKTTLANGYRLMMSREGIFDIDKMGMVTECNNLSDVDCMSKYHKDAFSVASETPTLKSDVMPTEYGIMASEEKSPFKWADVNYMFMTGDSVVYGVVPGDNTQYFDIVAALNGARKPNMAVQDLRKFRYSGNGGNIYDVSEELTVKPVACEYLTANKGCKTEEACNSLAKVKCNYDGTLYTSGSQYYYCYTKWVDGQCKKYINRSDINLVM